jgi:hypothetical protein
MIPLLLRRCVLAALLLTAASCSDIVPPCEGCTTTENFSLLIERRNAAGQRSFYTMSADGSQFAPFIGVPLDARRLIPSPDGKTIAYLRDFESYVQLWAMDRDGGNRRPILNGNVFIESAAWSPDGQRLALTYSSDAVSADIVTINADGTGFVDLTPDPSPGVIFDRDPTWSSDGTRLAFTSNRSGTRRLWVMNANGSAPAEVLPGVPTTARTPVWSPDSTNFIALVATTAAGPGITFVRADGSDYKHIVITPEPNDPVWLPDGRLVYVANPTGDYDLHTVDRVTGTTSQLTTRRDHDVYASVLTTTAPFTWLGFAAEVRYATNRPTATDLTTDDVIFDGNNDVLILSPVLNELRLMRGLGDGTLQSVGSLFAEDDVVTMRTASISTDLAPDIVGRGDSALYLWRGRVDGPGLSTRIFMNAAVRDFVLTDLDASGRADIVTLTEAAGQPFRLRTHTISTGDGIVAAVDMATSRTDGRSLCAGDFNNDGWQDIVSLAGVTSLTAYLSQGRGELGVALPVAAGASVSTDVEAVPQCADMNGDGRDDLVLLTNESSSNVSMRFFQFSTFGSPTRINVVAASIAITDIDRDGDLDVVMASATTPEILIAKNRGSGTFDAPTSFAITNVPRLVSATDLDGDTWPDLVILDATGGITVLVSRARTGM